MYVNVITIMRILIKRNINSIETIKIIFINEILFSN